MNSKKSKKWLQKSYIPYYYYYLESKAKFRSLEFLAYIMYYKTS